MRVALGDPGEADGLDTPASDLLFGEAARAADVRSDGLGLVEHRPALELPSEVAVRQEVLGQDDRPTWDAIGREQRALAVAYPAGVVLDVGAGLADVRRDPGAI